MTRYVEAVKRTVARWSSSRMEIFADVGLERVTPVAFDKANSKFSVDSPTASSRMVMGTSFALSPGAKVSVPAAPI